MRTDDSHDSGSAEDECPEHATEPGASTGIVHRVEPLVIRLARRPERERREAAIGGAAIHLDSHWKGGERGSDDQKTCPNEDADHSDAAAGRAGWRLIHDAQGPTIAPAAMTSAEQSFTSTSSPRGAVLQRRSAACARVSSDLRNEWRRPKERALLACQ